MLHPSDNNVRQDVHIVIIEWDGEIPPSNYYRRLHRLALRVRGDDDEKAMGPVARRTNDGENETGIIFQEGCVICPSEDLARQVAFMAQEHGAKNVLLGSANISDTFTQTPRDTEIIDRITKVLGKRGRKPAAVKWAISCKNCLQVTNHETWSPLNCPHCGGMLITARKGEVMAIIRTMPRDVAFAFLDAIVTARAHHTREARLTNRLAVVQEYFLRNGDPSKVSLVESVKPDLIDAGIGLGKANIVPWLLQQNRQ